MQTIFTIAGVVALFGVFIARSCARRIPRRKIEASFVFGTVAGLGFIALALLMRVGVL